MIDGFETAYEGKYDFPVREDEPKRIYMIATVPRSGSTHLSHLLWRTGCLGAPLEYLNYEEAGPYFFARNSPAQQRSLWASVLRRRTSPNGVFGLKCFPTQLQSLQETNPQLLETVLSAVLSGRHAPRIVWLGRRDSIAHAVSYARATISGVWRKEQEGNHAPPDYSEIAVDRAQRMLAAQSAAWESMFREMRIEPLRLFHEDVIASPDDVAIEVSRYLDIELQRESSVVVPQVRKQADTDSIEWIRRFSLARDANL